MRNIIQNSKNEIVSITSFVESEQRTAPFPFCERKILSKTDDVIDDPFFLIAALSYLRVLPKSQLLFSSQCFEFDFSAFQKGASEGFIVPYADPESFISRGIVSTIVHAYRGRTLSNITVGDLIAFLEEAV